MSAVMNEVVVRPTGAALGADIEGVDLAQTLDDITMNRIIEAWHDHLVLRFRNQPISERAFVEFGRRFGELDLPFTSMQGNPRRPDLPEMAVMSNIVENGRKLGALGNFEAAWHTDMSYLDIPPSASLLHAIEIPPAGGDTCFVNMYLAYETLPARLRARIEGRFCKHDHTYNSTGELRKGFSEGSDPRTTPGAIHPMVRTHPDTGRKALFVGRRLNAYIIGMELAESEELLDALFAHATQPAHVWTQKWKVGDLIIWDNRCTMHYRESFDNNTRRLLNRLQIKGNKPF